MRILQVVHGYPPRETAGTERHVQSITDALRRRGHVVQVVAATRAPGRNQYACMRQPGLTRIVQNMPTRPLASLERDRAIDAILADEFARFTPDVVHVHHLQFLSSGLRFDAPVVYTLHDGWTWCAAGGLELLADGTSCSGPAPDRCAPCAAAWAPVPGRQARALVGLAGRLANWVDPDALHRAYRRAPARMRARIHRNRAVTEPAATARDRNRAMAAFASTCTVTSPSVYLAEKARRNGLSNVRVVPHGIALEPDARSGTGPVLFLGTIARHKGVDRVVRAWRAAFPKGDPGLSLHGPVSEPAAAAGHPIGPILDRAGVRAALADARVLVMASIWDENAPLVLLEARAAGCPVVAPRRGGIPELVEDGRDGVLYEPGDQAALAAALQAVVGRKDWRPRPPRRLDHQIDEYESIYAELVQ